MRIAAATSFNLRHRAGWPTMLAFGLALCAVVSPAVAQMKTGTAMKDFNAVFRLSSPNSAQFAVWLLDADAPGCIYYPGQTPRLTFQIQNLSEKPLQTSATLDLIAFGTRGIPGDIWLPEVFLINDLPDEKIELDLPAKGWANLTREMSIPERFGGYAVVLDLGAGGRHLLATMARVKQPDTPRVQYPSQALDGVEPALLQRVGVRAVRWGLPFVSPASSNHAKRMADIERQIQDYQKHGVTVLVEVGAGDAPQPTGQPRPHLDDNGVTKPGKMDHVWLPSEDANYRAMVKTLVSKYGWPKGPITGFKLWNEPWEGTSISGWQADMPRFRELHRIMAEAVQEANREAGVDVLVGGADSSTNTWDKFFPDGSDEFLQYMDFCSIHYQGMVAPVLYKKWNNRTANKGRVLIWDTESWVANCDDRIGALVATNRAAGYDRSMGIFIGNLFTINHFGIGTRAKVFGDDGKATTRQIFTQSWPTVASLCAAQSFIGERRFREILFRNGLPWVYVFDGMNGNADDGTLVVVGDIGALFAQPDQMMFRTVRSLAELDAPSPDGKPQPYRGATMTLTADPDCSLYDFYANPVPSENGHYVIPLDSRGYFLRGDPARAGSFDRLISTIRAARVDGIAALEIKVHDFSQPVGKATPLRLTVTNVLNRVVSGRFAVEIAGNRTESAPVALQANETRSIEVAVAGLKATPDNRYPVIVRFTGRDGARAEVRDTLHVNQIARRTIKIDGQLSDWGGALPQVIEATGRATQTITEAAWLPMSPFDAGQEGGVATGFVAYDNDYFYFAAKVADTTPDAGTLRFATRDDEEYFYPEVATQKDKDGKTTELKWPEDVRRFSYRKPPILPAGCFPPLDNIQIAFNAIPPDEEPDLLTHLPGRMPGFVPVLDTDYEYALNTVAERYGGGFEVWRLRVPGMVSKNFYPRQPKGPLDGPVEKAKLVTRYEGNVRITELALPWSEIPHVKALKDAGKPLKFSFHVNNNTPGPLLELARGRSVSRQNNFTFHVDWRESWANEIEFAWE